MERIKKIEDGSEISYSVRNGFKFKKVFISVERDEDGELYFVVTRECKYILGLFEEEQPLELSYSLGELMVELNLIGFELELSEEDEINFLINDERKF